MSTSVFIVMISFCNAFHLYSWRVVCQVHKDIKEKQEVKENEICQLHVDMSTCDGCDNVLTSVDSVDTTPENSCIYSMCGFGCMFIGYVLCTMIICYFCYSKDSWINQINCG